MEQNYNSDGLMPDLSISKSNPNQDELNLSPRSHPTINNVWLTHLGSKEMNDVISSEQVSSDDFEYVKGSHCAEEPSVSCQQVTVLSQKIKLLSPPIMERSNSYESPQKAGSYFMQVELDAINKECLEDMAEVSEKQWDDETGVKEAPQKVDNCGSKRILKDCGDQKDQVDNYALVAPIEESASIDSCGVKLTHHQKRNALSEEIHFDHTLLENAEFNQSSSKPNAGKLDKSLMEVVSSEILCQIGRGSGHASTSTESVLIDSNFSISQAQSSKDKPALLTDRNVHGLLQEQIISNDNLCDKFEDPCLVKASVKVSSCTPLKQLEPHKEPETAKLLESDAVENSVNGMKIKSKSDLKLPSFLNVLSEAKLQYALMKTDLGEEFDVIRWNENDSENDFKLSQKATAPVPQRTLLNLPSEKSRSKCGVEIEDENDVDEGHIKSDFCLEAREFNITFPNSKRSMNGVTEQESDEYDVKVDDLSLAPVMEDGGLKVDNVMNVTKTPTSTTTQEAPNLTISDESIASIADLNADIISNECDNSNCIPLVAGCNTTKVDIENVTVCAAMATIAYHTQYQHKKIASVFEKSEVISSSNNSPSKFDINTSVCFHDDLPDDLFVFVSSCQSQVGELNETAGDNRLSSQVRENIVSEKSEGCELATVEGIQSSEVSDKVHDIEEDMGLVELSGIGIKHEKDSSGIVSVSMCSESVNQFEDQTRMEHVNTWNCEHVVLVKVESTTEQDSLREIQTESFSIKDQFCSTVENTNQMQRISRCGVEESTKDNSGIIRENEPKEIVNKEIKDNQSEWRLSNATDMVCEEMKVDGGTKTCSYSNIENIHIESEPPADFDDLSLQHVDDEKSSVKTDATCTEKVNGVPSIKPGDTSKSEASLSKTDDAEGFTTGKIQCEYELAEQCHLDIDTTREDYSHFHFGQPQHPKFSCDLVSQSGNEYKKSISGDEIPALESNDVDDVTDDVSTDTDSSILWQQSEAVDLIDLKVILQCEEVGVQLEPETHCEILHAVDNSVMVEASNDDVAIHSRHNENILLDNCVVFETCVNAFAERNCVGQFGLSSSLLDEFESTRTHDEVSLTSIDHVNSEICSVLGTGEQSEEPHLYETVSHEGLYRNEDSISEFRCGKPSREVLGESKEENVCYHVVPVCNNSMMLNSGGVVEISNPSTMASSMTSSNVLNSTVGEKRKMYVSCNEFSNCSGTSCSKLVGDGFQVGPLLSKKIVAKDVSRPDQTLDDYAVRFENEQCLYEEDQTCGLTIVTDGQTDGFAIAKSCYSLVASSKQWVTAVKLWEAKRILLDKELNSSDMKTLDTSSSSDKAQEFTPTAANINQQAAGSLKVLETAYRWRCAPSLNAEERPSISAGDRDETPSSGSTVLAALRTNLRPMRLGLSRRQRTTSLHPYLKNAPS